MESIFGVNLFINRASISRIKNNTIFVLVFPFPLILIMEVEGRAT